MPPPPPPLKAVDDAIETKLNDSSNPKSAEGQAKDAQNVVDGNKESLKGAAPDILGLFQKMLAVKDPAAVAAFQAQLSQQLAAAGLDIGPAATLAAKARVAVADKNTEAAKTEQANVEAAKTEQPKPGEAQPEIKSEGKVDSKAGEVGREIEGKMTARLEQQAQAAAKNPNSESGLSR